MKEPVLIDALGDSVNLRILNFFIENPFDAFSIQQIGRFAKVSRNSVYKYLPEFEEKGYLIRERNGNREVYRLNKEDKVVKLIDEFVDNVGNVYLEPLRRKASVKVPYDPYVNMCMTSNMLVTATSSG